MASFHLRLPIGGSVAESLTELPQRAKTFLKDGFRVLHKVYDRNPGLLVKVAVESVSSRQLVEEPSLLSALGVSTEEARLIIGTLNFLALLLSSSAEPSGQIAEALTKAGVSEAQQRDTVVNFVNLLRQTTPSLKQIVATASLASELLPSFLSFEFTVDIRLGFEQESVLAVPILLVHFDSDVPDDSGMWFQMTKRQAEKLAEDLKTAIERLDRAEKLIERGLR